MQEFYLRGVLTDRLTGEIGAEIDVKSRRVRCQKCADGPVPEIPVVIQKRVEFVSQPKPKSSFKSMRTLADDWKIKQAGE
jgi:hypothetical protein